MVTSEPPRVIASDGGDSTTDVGVVDDATVTAHVAVRPFDVAAVTVAVPVDTGWTMPDVEPTVATPVAFDV